MQLTAVEFYQLNPFVAFHCLENETGEEFNGIGALLVDIVAGVSAHESFQGAFQEETALQSLLALEGELGCGITTTCATDEDLTLVF